MIALAFAFFLQLRLVKNWWVSGIFEKRPVVTELFHSHPTSLGAAELFKALMYGDLASFDDVYDFADGTTEVVHACGEDEACTAECRGLASGDDPVSVHAGENDGGVVGNEFGVTAKLETFGILENEWFDFNQRDRLELLFKVDRFQELLVG